MEQRRVKVTGCMSGHYLVHEHRPDGSLVLSPALTIAEILARHGEREVTAEEFERDFGHLSADGEG